MLTALLLAIAMAPTATPNAGLLVGLAYDPGDGIQRQRTLWVTWSDSEPALSGNWPILILTHGRDLCRVRIEPVVTERYTFGAFAIQCGSELEPPVPEPVPPGCSGERTLSVSFVSPNYVSMEAWEESVCSGKVNSYPDRFVVPVSSFVDHWRLSPDDESLPVSAVLSADVLEDFQRSAREKCESLNNRDPEELFVRLPDCRGPLFHDDYTEWTVRRGSGRWDVLAKLAGWRGEVIYYTVPVDLPNSVAPSQRAHSETPSTATDVLVAPDGRVAALVSADAIKMVVLGAAPEDSPTLVVPKGSVEEIVMVEWAMGRFATEWSAILKQRFGRGNQ